MMRSRSVPSKRRESTRSTKKSLLVQIDEEYTDRNNSCWQVDDSTKSVLVVWLKNVLRISTAHRLQNWMRSEGKATKITDLVKVRMIPKSLRHSVDMQLEISSDSAIDMNMEDYIAAMINYDRNLDPRARGAWAAQQLYSRIIDFENNQLNAEELDKLTVQIALNNEWRNGLFLSEVLANAVYVGYSKETVKQIESPCQTELRGSTCSTVVSASITSVKDLHRTKRIVLNTTEDKVKSKAQAYRNINECLKLVRQTPVQADFPIDCSAESILFGSPDYMWMIIKLVYDYVRKHQRNERDRRGRKFQRSHSAPSRICPGNNSKVFVQSVNPFDRDRGNGDNIVKSQEILDECMVGVQQRINDLDRARITNIVGSSGQLLIGPRVDRQSTENYESTDTSNRLAMLRSEQFRSRVTARKYRITKHLADGVITSQETKHKADSKNSAVSAIAKQLVARDAKGKVKTANSSATSCVDRPSPPRKAWDPSNASERPRDGKKEEIPTPVKISRDNLPKQSFASPPRRALPIKAPQKGYWAAPAIDPQFAKDIQRAASLMSISFPQQNAVRDWLLALGINIRDGEGGYFYHGHSTHTAIVAKLNPNVYGNGNIHHSDPVTAFTGPGSNNGPYYGQYNPRAGYDLPSVPLPATAVTDPLPLFQDKLRNGEILCDLVCVLEPVVASHTNIAKLVKREPRTLKQASENIERALWLFRIKKSPPIPTEYLCQTEGILKGIKDLLWGLLWEIMQAYPSPVNGSPSTFISQGFGSEISTIGSHFDGCGDARRQLDVSLIGWLRSIGVLALFSGALAIPSTIHSMEGPIRDGTLLCMVLEFGFRKVVRAINKSPHTYSQCLSNVQKCLTEIRQLPGMAMDMTAMGARSVDSLCEGIVRGDWSMIYKLLAELHKSYCLGSNDIDGGRWQDVAYSVHVQENHQNQPFLQNRCPQIPSASPVNSHNNSFQPKLPIADGINGQPAAPFMDFPRPVLAYDTQQELPFSDQVVPETVAPSLKQQLPIADSSLSDAGSQLKAVNRDLYPAKYSQSIANAFNDQCTALDAGSSLPLRGEQGKLAIHQQKYSVHDLTGNDPVLDSILGPRNVNGFSTRISSASGRDPSPTASVLSEIDTVLADKHKWSKSPTSSNMSAVTGHDIVPGNVSGGALALSSNLRPDSSGVRKGRLETSLSDYIAREYEEISMKTTDFGSGQGESILPDSSNSRSFSSMPVLQAQTRERESTEQQLASSQGNVIRDVHGPHLGPNPSKLRLEVVNGRQVAESYRSDRQNENILAPSNHSTNRHQPHTYIPVGDVKPRQSRVYSGGLTNLELPIRQVEDSGRSESDAAYPDWVRQTIDPVYAGVDAGPPKWVAELASSQPQHLTRATMVTTPTGLRKSKSTDPGNAVSSLPYDESCSVTASPQSIADDSILSTPVVAKGHMDRSLRNSSAVGVASIGVPTIVLLGQSVNATNRPQPNKPVERVHFKLPGSKAMQSETSAAAKQAEAVANSLTSVGDLVAEKRVRDASKIINWLEKLSIRINNKEDFVHAYMINSNLTEFSNGVLLGQLAGKLERQVDIPGFTAYPKSAAQGLQNIRRVLEVFAKNNKIKISTLSNAEDIHEGKGVAIMELLTTLKKVYAHIVC